MDTAINAIREKEAPILVTCGWPYRPDSNLAIADVMREYAISRGVTSTAVIADTDSRDTVGDAVFTKRNLAVPRSWTNILVVTSAYHADRTKEVFSFIYGSNHKVDVRGAPSEDTDELRTNEQKSLQAFRSTFEGILPGDDEAIFERLRDRHPFYNGATYPRV